MPSLQEVCLFNAKDVDHKAKQTCSLSTLADYEETLVALYLVAPQPDVIEPYLRRVQGRLFRMAIRVQFGPTS